MREAGSRGGGGSLELGLDADSMLRCDVTGDEDRRKTMKG